MIELKINVENEEIKDAFVNFIMNYKGNISDYMNQLIGNNGSPCDADITLVDGTVNVYHIAPDKGFVMGETGNEELPIQIMQYKDLEAEKRYILPEKDRLILFYKQPTGTADLRLGAFKALSDTVKGFNSDAVKLELNRIAEIKNAKEKEDRRTENRLKRQGLVKSETEDAQSEPVTESQVIAENEQ